MSTDKPYYQRFQHLGGFDDILAEVMEATGVPVGSTTIQAPDNNRALLCTFEDRVPPIVFHQPETDLHNAVTVPFPEKRSDMVDMMCAHIAKYQAPRMSLDDIAAFFNGKRNANEDAEEQIRRRSERKPLLIELFGQAPISVSTFDTYCYRREQAVIIRGDIRDLRFRDMPYPLSDPHIRIPPKDEEALIALVREHIQDPKNALTPRDYKILGSEYA